MKIVALAGGVGGAKMASGLSQIVSPKDLTVIVNVGDDFEHLGLKICPDLDTVCYTLADIANPMTGWGRDQESWNAFESLTELSGPNWFRLGDRDLGTHLARTYLLSKGYSLSQITELFCRAWGVQARIFPVSDDPIPTLVLTDEGQLSFQEYFVKSQCQPKVKGFKFQGIQKAKPNPEVIRALGEAQIVVICPSNPWVSIDPMLSVPGMRESLLVGEFYGRRAVVAISPIIAGEAIKGPAAKMFSEMGIKPSALAVAQHYGEQTKGGILMGFVFDRIDKVYLDSIEAIGLRTLITNTVMKTPTDRKRLAEEVIAFGFDLVNEISTC